MENIYYFQLYILIEAQCVWLYSVYTFEQVKYLYTVQSRGVYIKLPNSHV